MKYKAILFDMDGLLFDTELITYQAYLTYCNKNNLHGDFNIYAKLIGRNYNDVGSILYQVYDDKFNWPSFYNYAQTYKHNYMLKNGIPLKPGFFQLMAYCQRHRIKMALVSSSDTSVIRKYLNLASLNNTFDCIIGGNMVTHSKPNPEIYQLASKKLNIPSSQCLVLEDSANGILAANQAFMDVICIPDMVMHDDSILNLCIRVYPSLDKVIEVL